MRASLSRVALACGLLLTGPLAVRAQSAGGGDFAPLPPGPPPAGAASPSLPNPSNLLPGTPVGPSGQPEFNAPNGLPGTPVTAGPAGNASPNYSGPNYGGTPAGPTGGAPSAPGLAGGAAANAASKGTAARQTIIDVVVRGNKSVPLSKTQSYLRTRKGREFDPETVQGDVRRLNQSGLFRDVRTSTEPGAGGVIVVFEVFERPLIGYIKFVGNRGIRDKALLKQCELKVGEALNQFTVEEGRRKVEEFYHSKGFPKTQVSIMEGDKSTDEGVVYLINEGALERISSVNFIGNTIASDDRLKTQIQSKPGFLWYFFRGKVERKKIDEDIERLTAYYRSLGYFRARIGRELEFDETGRWLTLTFVIDEGPRYVVRNVSIVGNEKFTNDSLMQQLELNAGEYFNQAEMNRDLTTLRDAYGAKGHVYADIQADPRFLEEPGQLDLVYRIKEGEVFRVGNINVKIDGEYPHTRQSVVMTRISLRPGDILDVRELRRSEQRLKASQLFETDPSKGSPPQLVVVPPDMQGIASSLKDPPPKPRNGSKSYR